MTTTHFKGAPWCTVCKHWIKTGHRCEKDLAVLTLESESVQTLINRFKKTICVEMGRTSSSLIAIKTLPLAWAVAEAMELDPYEFSKKIGFQDTLIQTECKKGCPACGEKMEWEPGHGNPRYNQPPGWVCLNHGVEFFVPVINEFSENT